MHRNVRARQVSGVIPPDSPGIFNKNSSCITLPTAICLYLLDKCAYPICYLPPLISQVVPVLTGLRLVKRLLAISDIMKREMCTWILLWSGSQHVILLCL